MALILSSWGAAMGKVGLIYQHLAILDTYWMSHNGLMASENDVEVEIAFYTLLKLIIKMLSRLVDLDF